MHIFKWRLFSCFSSMKHMFHLHLAWLRKTHLPCEICFHNKWIMSVLLLQPSVSGGLICLNSCCTWACDDILFSLFPWKWKVSLFMYTHHDCFCSIICTLIFGHKLSSFDSSVYRYTLILYSMTISTAYMCRHFVHLYDCMEKYPVTACFDIFTCICPK